MFHVKEWTSITGILRPIFIELGAIPLVAILVSLREKRYWCRKICPVGVPLNFAGSFSPFIKPTVKVDKCVMKGCRKDCEDYRLDYCVACRHWDQKRCEKVCPQDVNLLDEGSLVKCTKCLECYIQCEYDAIEIKLAGTPDAVSTIRRFKAKIKRQTKKLCKLNQFIGKFQRYTRK
jgi:polyferredoxin